MNTKIISFSTILIIAIAVSSWIAVNMARSMLKQVPSSPDSSDFFMTNVVYTQMDENGVVHNQIYTNKLDHYLKNDRYVFNAPHIMMVDQDNNSWQIDAKQGISENNGAVVNLWDDVKIVQMVGMTSSQAGMTVTTSAATVYPQKGFATTDKPVVIAQGGSVVNSVGAEVNFKNSTVKLLSKVQGQYEATKK